MGQHCQARLLHLPFKKFLLLSRYQAGYTEFLQTAMPVFHPVFPPELCPGGCSRLTAFSHHQVVSTLIFDGQEYFWDHDQDAALGRRVDAPSALGVCRVVPRIVGWFNISSVVSQLPSTLPVWKRNTQCKTRQREAALQPSCSHISCTGGRHTFPFLHVLQVQLSLPASHIPVWVCLHVSVCVQALQSWLWAVTSLPSILPL